MRVCAYLNQCLKNRWLMAKEIATEGNGAYSFQFHMSVQKIIKRQDFSFFFYQ